MLCRKPFLKTCLPKVHRSWTYLSSDTTSSTGLSKGNRSISTPFHSPGEEFFSTSLLLSTALIIQLPLLKVPTIHLLPLSISGIFVHPTVSALPSISLHHISGGWWWRLQHPCPPDILRLKTLQHADHYKLPSVCSAPWPLWPNLEAKQISVWPHLQNATVRVSQC